MNLIRNTLLILFFGIHLSLSAQNQGQIHGMVQSEDSHALVKATVSVISVQDSSLISYSLTDEKGKFRFVRLPKQTKLLLYISHINARPFQQEFSLDETNEIDFGTIRLAGNCLDEVVITAAAPVRMNKDTLEYNVDYFKTRPNANVEELLKELPGLQVNMDGTIYYEGKEVSQVKVDGKDFFNTDVRIATRNLDASLIKTVQVYRDRGESKISVEDEENLPITINLKFRNEFLRTDFGKTYGSGGSRDRYEAGALFNTFRDTLQISFIAYGNNVNRQSFDYNELNQHAGLGRAEDYGFNDFGGQNYWGIGNDLAGGININNDWGRNPRLRHTKLNLMYMYRFNGVNSADESTSVFMLDEVAQHGVSSSRNKDKRQEHSITSFLRHRFDSTAYVEIRPQMNISKNGYTSDSQQNSFNDLQSLTDATDRNEQSAAGFNYSHQFYAEKQFYGKQVFSLRSGLNLNERTVESLRDQQTTMYQMTDTYTSIWESSAQINRTNRFDLTANYNHKLTDKLSFNIYSTVMAGIESPRNVLHYDRNGTGLIRGRDFENDYTFSYRDYISGIRLTWTPRPRLTINFGASHLFKTTEFDFIPIAQHRNQAKTYWLQNFEIRYKDINLGWSNNVRNPRAYDIQVQQNDLNPTSTILPSLDFNQIQTQRAFIGYNRYKGKLQLGGRISLNYDATSVGRRTWHDIGSGHVTSQRYQAGSNYNVHSYIYFRYNFKIGKDWQYYISVQPNFDTYQSHQTINDISNQFTTSRYNMAQEFSILWKNLIGLTPRYVLNFHRNTNSVKHSQDFRTTNLLSHDIGFGLNINPIKGFSLQGTYSLQNRASGISSRASYHLINSSLYYNLKNQSQIKLSAFDILNQNVQNHWGATGNSTYYSNSLTLRQYFLLGYIHKFHLTKTKQ